MEKQAVSRLLRSAGDHFIDMVDLIWPKICLACEQPLYKHEETLCTVCLVSLPRTNFHRFQDNPVSRMLWGKAQIEGAASYFHFEKSGPVQRLIHQFKYKGFKETGIEIGKQYGAELKTQTPFSEVDLIIPVPLHKNKLKKRGYNQSEFFAAGLAQSMGVPYDNNLLFRAVDTETQTHKTRYERFTNVEKIFTLRTDHGISGKHILLVDDVITTGSTLEACAHVLAAAGCKVSVATMAFAK